jgi:hypothetical protein
MSLPGARGLAEAARATGWELRVYDETPDWHAQDRVVFYGGVDVALEVAKKFGLALLEPPLDLLARLPLSYRLRNVEFGRYSDLTKLKSPTFVKPADPVNKCFDAGIYSHMRDIRTKKPVPAGTPVLVAEPVEWSAEYRCFIVDRKVVTSSPYLSFNRPIWHPWGEGGEKATESKTVLAFCQRLLSQSGMQFPPAFVVDIGLIDERGWAVVEFNPAWCAGILGTNPRFVLDAVSRACQPISAITNEDRRWLVER